MADPTYLDEFGFYSPMPLDRGTRREPGADFPSGPPVGATLPPVCLPDQHGAIVDVAERRGHRGAILVFHRSAYW